MDNLFKQAEEARAMLESAQKTILRIQEQCSHPKEVLEIISKSNTGNYDPSSDCYWKEFRCGICRKFWMEE